MLEIQQGTKLQPLGASLQEEAKYISYFIYIILPVNILSDKYS